MEDILNFYLPELIFGDPTMRRKNLSFGHTDRQGDMEIVADTGYSEDLNFTMYIKPDEIRALHAHLTLQLERLTAQGL